MDRGCQQQREQDNLDTSVSYAPAAHRTTKFRHVSLIALGAFLLLCGALWGRSYWRADGAMVFLKFFDARFVSNRGSITMQLWRYRGQMHLLGVSLSNQINPAEEFSAAWRNWGFQLSHIRMGGDGSGGSYWALSIPYWLLIAAGIVWFWRLWRSGSGRVARSRRIAYRQPGRVREARRRLTRLGVLVVAGMVIASMLMTIVGTLQLHAGHGDLRVSGYGVSAGYYAGQWGWDAQITGPFLPPREHVFTSPSFWRWRWESVALFCPWWSILTGTALLALPIWYLAGRRRQFSRDNGFPAQCSAQTDHNANLQVAPK